MQREFQRVAIVNRGEAAIRFIHAAREFNREHGTSITTIALYTEPDRHAMFVREADEAVYLGTARVTDPATNQSKSTYVDYASLQSATKSARADAVWVGWGFVAEHPDFADLCRDLGILYIGPDGDAMRRCCACSGDNSRWSVPGRRASRLHSAPRPRVHRIRSAASSVMTRRWRTSCRPDRTLCW